MFFCICYNLLFFIPTPLICFDLGYSYHVNLLGLVKTSFILKNFVCNFLYIAEITHKFQSQKMSFIFLSNSVREYWHVFVLESFLHAANKKLVFLPKLSIIDTRQARKNLTKKKQNLGTRIKQAVKIFSAVRILPFYFLHSLGWRSSDIEYTIYDLRNGF